MTPAPDVHARAPRRGAVGLRSVGVSGIHKPLAIARAGPVHHLSVVFDVAVDLPADRKGSDLSRNAEILAEIVDETALRPVASLESACSTIARELLARHAYATEASVDATAEYFLRPGIREERRSFEEYTLLAEAHAVRAGDGGTRVTRAIGAEAVGMTACPCAMETCRDRLAQEFPLLRDPSLAELPIVTHNQRNRTRLVFELDETTEVEVDEMIGAIEAAQSSPTYAILKRGDEAEVVLRAHRHPKFAEDVVRELLGSVLERFPSLPDATTIRAATRSEESIHKYDVEASHRITVGELRAMRAD
jgi:GTP cyclohydrolase IV